MNTLYGAYGVLTSGLFVPLFPAFWTYTRITGKYRRHLRERLGILSQKAIQGPAGDPRIWIHAASLGEVKVAASLVNPLKNMMPACSLIVSTVTEHGRKLAEELFGREVSVIYAPIDFFISVRKALSNVRPDVMVFLETELWPAWIFEARRMGVRIALINGRISIRSFRGYFRLRWFFREVLKCLDKLSMIREEDAARIKAIGADPEKVVINGNAKYDLLASTVNPELELQMRKTLNLHGSDRVFVAGSIREGEENLVLDAYAKILKAFPEIILIIAPRHLDRIPLMESLSKKRGFGVQLWTDIVRGNEKRTAQVVIVNTFGELFKIYSVGTIVFCGGSLVPMGGQNPLEPAVWGKVVLYGPSMYNFSDAKALLEADNAGMQVSSYESLAEKTVWFLGRPEQAKAYGQRGRTAVLKNEGAGEKHAQVITELWKSRVNV
jgi:3-deoxy-D-manno-octulosonic-acid transferase